MERAARRARGVRRGAGWARRVLACVLLRRSSVCSVDHLSHFQGKLPQHPCSVDTFLKVALSKSK